MSILLLGSGPAVGLGVLSHELGLAGHIARQLFAASGRATSVQTIVDMDMRAEDAAATLGWVALDRFDGLLVTFGGNEVLALVSDRSWRRSLRGFFDTVGGFSSAGLATFVLGVAPISSLVTLPRLARALVDDRVDSLNEITRQMCAAIPNTTFVPFEPVAPEGVNLVDEGRSQMYADWAGHVVPSLSRWVSVTA